MIKKDSIYQVLLKLIEENIKEYLVDKKFSFNKKQIVFKRKKGGFVQLISFSKDFLELVWLSELEEMYLVTTLSSELIIPKFNTWLGTNRPRIVRFKHPILYKSFVQKLSNQDLPLIQSFKASSSKNYRANISSSFEDYPYNNILKRYEKLDMNSLKETVLASIVDQLEAYSNFETLVRDSDYGRLLLLYQGKVTEAKKRYTEMHAASLKALEHDQDADKIKFYNRIVEEAEEMVGLTFKRYDTGSN